MIFVDRNRVPPPSGLFEYHQQEVERLVSIFNSPEGKNPQRRNQFLLPKKLRNSIRDSLRELFHDRCAYCERTGREIDHFRPRSRATRLDGSIDPDHYWWLASDWRNLYWACSECNLRKRNLFPIQGKAARPLSSWDQLGAELPLLIDPCSDSPQDHLRFLGDGLVVPLTDRGAATIKILQLNESFLSKVRSNQASLVSELLLSKALPKDSEIPEVFQRFEHQAVTNALINEASEPHAKADSTTVESEVSAEAIDAIEAIPDAIWLKTVEVHNFKVINKLKISFPAPRSDGDSLSQPWLMVLGENGVGKSSLLQAIALAMMPANDRDALDARTWLRNGKGVRTGFVRLTFSNASERLITFKKNDSKFETEGETPNLPVLAYGSTRLLPGANGEMPDSPKSVSVRNLFEHTHPLVNAELYLCDRSKISEDRFNLLAASLKELLPVSENAILARTHKHMSSKVDGKTVSLSELSDGYKSVLALAMDIMFHLSSSSFDMESVQGLVMIDELELHLHPRWKIQIVDRLRQLFPLVRFVVSTHDPLCVHGLDQGELWVMARNPEDKSFIIEQIDVPPGTRADEILTGPWFGLQSTIDTDTQMLMSEHSALLQQKKPNKRRLAYLEKILSERLGSFGNTRVQRAELVVAAELERAQPEEQVDQKIMHRLNKILAGEF